MDIIVGQLFINEYGGILHVLIDSDCLYKL